MGKRKPEKLNNEPGYQFRGTHTPPEIHFLLETGKITTTEFVLLAVIDALVDPNPDGVGCWASNAYLAKRVNKSKWWIQGMIRRLKHLGLVTTNTRFIPQVKDDRRVIETTWSRIRWGGVVGNMPPRVVGNTHSKTINTNALAVASANAEIDGTGENSVLLEGFNTPPEKTKYSNEDLQWATALREVLLKKGIGVGKPVKLKLWASHIATLVKQKGNRDSVKKVFDWYLKHIREPFIPHAWSGKGFAEDFDRIVDKMIKDLKDNPIYVETPIGKKVMAQIRHLRWRNGLSEQLPAQVEQSITEYDAFMTRLKKWQRDMETMVRLRNMISGDLRQLTNFGYQVRSHLQTAEQFIPKWFKAVWEWAHKKNFNLKRLSTYSFTPTHKQMTQWGTEWAGGYGNSKLWEKLMEAINGA